MKKIQIISLCLIGLIIFSCGTSNNVVSKGIFSKRKVNKGYFYNPNRKIKNTSEEVTAEVRQPFIQYEKEESISIEKETFTSVEQEQEAVETTENQDQNISVDAIEIRDESSKKVVNSTLKPIEKSKTILEKKSVINESKKTVKKFKQNHSAFSLFDLLILILCFVIPFLAVFLSEGTWNTRCWINLILCLLFVLPGIIHALIVCF